MAPMKKVMKDISKQKALTENNVKKHQTFLKAGADNEEDALAQFNTLNCRGRPLALMMSWQL